MTIRLLNFDKKGARESPDSMTKVLGENSKVSGDSIAAGGSINAPDCYRSLAPSFLIGSNEP